MCMFVVWLVLLVVVSSLLRIVFIVLREICKMKQDHVQRMHNEIESTTRKLELETGSERRGPDPDGNQLFKVIKAMC